MEQAIADISHAETLQVTYRRQPGDGTFVIASAIVIVDGNHWPPAPASVFSATVQWAMSVTGLDEDSVLLMAGPAVTQPDPPSQPSRLGTDRRGTIKQREN